MPADNLPALQMQNLNYAEAVNAALHRAMTHLPDTILFGEDVAKPGGVFGVTKNLRQQFADRVFDTPISESAILGAAVGAAMLGRRPIVEIMWIDFSLVALDQIVNQAANVRYVSAGRLQAPLTIRTQQGALPGSCAQHSQNLEALFAHIPGVLVGLPSTPQDAHDMLLSAIHADDPALIIEHRGLYFGPKVEVRLDGPVPPVGGARVRRNGQHATIVSWGAMMQKVLDAASALEMEGISVEVIDLRWLTPLDWPTVLASVTKTSRLLIVHEANVTGGFGAEIAARAADEAVYFLAGPVRRLGVPDSRIPAAPHLQDALIPGVASIVAAVRSLLDS